MSQGVAEHDGGPTAPYSAYEAPTKDGGAHDYEHGDDLGLQQDALYVYEVTSQF
jgi:hypothetical protein